MKTPGIRRGAVGWVAMAALVAPGSLLAQRAGLGSCPTGDAGSVQVGFEGVVIDDESEIPLPGAIVRLSYENEPGLPDLDDVTTSTDERGRYRFCQLEAFRSAKVRATYLLRRGKERRIELERPQDLELKVDLGDPAFIVFTIVDADDGTPIEGATVELSPIPVGGITNQYGRASFRAIPPGDYEMTVRHIAYAERTEAISLDEEQLAELRVELRTQAIALAPLEVQITGRDPYLLDNGFYERKLSIGDDGYFGTYEEIRSYVMLRTLFQFKRELSIRFARNQFVLLNGRPMSWLGYTSIRQLSELPYSRIRGVEAYSCSDAPDALMIRIRADVPIGDCNLIAIWTR
ncbi:MAG: collagen binding domain-containing protein [Gemmatimonadota bacterium]